MRKKNPWGRGDMSFPNFYIEILIAPLRFSIANIPDGSHVFRLTCVLYVHSFLAYNSNIYLPVESPTALRMDKREFPNEVYVIIALAQRDMLRAVEMRVALYKIREDIGKNS